jgi:hypothetical protein
VFLLLVAMGVAGAVSFAALGGSASSTSASARKSKPAESAASRPDAAVTSGFSVLADPSVPAAPERVIAGLREMHAGAYADAKDAGRGMYLATNDGSLCAWVDSGFAECTDSLNQGDVWLHGTMIRETDSETAPFEVDLYGFARDGVEAVQVVTSDGVVHRLAVTNNAFRGTLGHTSFGDLNSIQAVYKSGSVSELNTAKQFQDPLK